MPVSWAYINCTDAAVSGSDGQIQFAQNVNGTVKHGSSAALRFSTASAAQGASPDNLLQVTGNVAISGTLIANAYKVNVHEVNIIHSTGSTRFGDTTDDKHQFSGSVYAIGDISGSAAISGSQLYTTNLVSNRARVQIPASVSLSFNGVTNTAKITNSGTNLDINSPGNIVLNSGNPNNVTSSGNLVVGGNLSASNCFYTDRTNERVGIGTTTPAYSLDVNGYISVGSAGTGYLIHNTDTDTYIKFGGSGRPGVDGMTFVAGGKSILTIDENGRDIVTIGSGSTDTDLDVHGVISGSACISGSTLQLEAFKTNRLFAQVSSSLAMGGGTTVEGGQYWGGDNRISILRTNTTANGTTLHIGATAGTRILVSGSAQSQIAGKNVTLSADQGIVLQSHMSGNSALAIGQNLSASNTLYVDRTRGSVGIDIRSEMSEKLDVNGSARFRSIGSATSAGALHYTSNGTLTTNTSDKRLKENITEIDNALNKVISLRGVYHTWKEDFEGDRTVGSLAQEVLAVVPELAFTNDNTGYMGVHYDKMAPLLIEAIKEQQGLIENQQSAIESLIARIDALEGHNL